jgi:hypothetical protein
MIPAKAKAKAIFKKYAKGKDEHGWFLTEFDSCSKLCALISVEQIIDEYQSISDLESTLVVGGQVMSIVDKIVYWEQVEREIIKL